MFFTLPNFYILLSLYPLQFFMELCQFVVVGCSGFKFFLFLFSWNFVGLWLWVALDLSFFFVFFFFADFHIFFFLLCCQIYGKEESRNFFNYIFLSLFFCMQFLLDFSFLGILLFGFNSRFVLVDIQCFSHLHFTLVWIFFFLFLGYAIFIGLLVSQDSSI